ncbi:polysaccharide pyruvyl transferase family protein [Gordonia sp. NPDC003585]|uniref:polysaccharide pyruvyl transferase family protein n=1 Tax=Gordonia sp. NPDC003585 TaxID=3154275 RepID=UPI0033B6EE10
MTEVIGSMVPQASRPAARRPHIVLVNAWHDDNKGDSAITEGVLSLATHVSPHATVSVVGLTENPDQGNDAMRHIARRRPDAVLLPNPMPSELRGRDDASPLVDVPIWFSRLLSPAAAMAFGRVPQRYRRIFADADLVVGVGGSNLYTDASVQPVVSLARLFTLAAPLTAASRMGIPTVLLGHTLGPFPASRPAARRLAARMLGGANHTVVRDEKSLTVARELGLAKPELAPDMAYAITSDNSSRVDAAVTAVPAEMARTAVIAMRAHPSLEDGANDRVIAQIIDATATLRRTGLIDHVLVVAHTLGPTRIEDDRPISHRLHAALDRHQIPASYADEDLSPTELAALYGRAACMIAVRLHAAVLATLSGTPTFAIAYFSSKSEGVMRASGLGDAVAGFAEVTGGHIATALGRQMNSPSARSRLAAITDGHRTNLQDRACQWFAPVTDPHAAGHHVGRDEDDSYDKPRTNNGS